jgi:hypothetical protein
MEEDKGEQTLKLLKELEQDIDRFIKKIKNG